MKKAWLIFGVLVLLVCSSSPLWANGTIDFIQFTEDPVNELAPVVITYSSTVTPQYVEPGVENAYITFFNLSYFSNPTGLYGGMAYEPGTTKPSDVAFMTFYTWTPPVAAAYFFSDGFSVPPGGNPIWVGDNLIYNFQQAVDLYNDSNTVKFPPISETGGVDTIMHFFNSSALEVKMVSDLDAPAPLPASVLMLGSGLLGLAALRRRS